MNFYTVFTMKELSEKIGISQQAISKWKNNNSIVAIKKKCRELGIYNEIFGDLNTQNIQNQIIDTQNGINSFNNFAESNKQKIM